MGEQARLPLDAANRRLPPTAPQQSIASQHPQSNSQNVENPLADHLRRAWESAATAVAVTCGQLKRQAIIPFLHWALSALGSGRTSTALPTPAPPPTGRPQQEAKRWAEQAEEREKIQIRLVELGKSLANEKKDHEKVRIRCEQLERDLGEAKKHGEKMEALCLELESSLAEEEEKRKKQAEMEARMKRARDELLAQMERILKDSQKEEHYGRHP